MIERTRYEILDSGGRYVLASVTLYGDSDNDTDAILLGMIKESIPVSAAITGARSVVVKWSRQSLPGPIDQQ